MKSSGRKTQEAEDDGERGKRADGVSSGYNGVVGKFTKNGIFYLKSYSLSLSLFISFHPLPLDCSNLSHKPTPLPNNILWDIEFEICVAMHWLINFRPYFSTNLLFHTVGITMLL